MVLRCPKADTLDIIDGASSPPDLVSQLWSAKRLEFGAAGLTEIVKKINRPGIDHLPQLDEGLVRLKILYRRSRATCMRGQT
jgi:hypothetical protein